MNRRDRRRGQQGVNGHDLFARGTWLPAIQAPKPFDKIVDATAAADRRFFSRSIRTDAVRETNDSRRVFAGGHIERLDLGSAAGPGPANAVAHSSSTGSPSMTT